MVYGAFGIDLACNCQSAPGLIRWIKCKLRVYGARILNKLLSVLCHSQKDSAYLAPLIHIHYRLR